MARAVIGEQILIFDRVNNKSKIVLDIPIAVLCNGHWSECPALPREGSTMIRPLLSWLGRAASSHRGPRAIPPIRKKHFRITHFRPTLQQLEDRTVPTSVFFSGPSWTVAETAGQAQITVFAAPTVGNEQATFSVDYSTSDGTATAGNDYGAVSGTLNFGLNDWIKSFYVPIYTDPWAGGDETVNLTLSNPVGTEIFGPNPTILTIHDVPPMPPPSVQFSTSSYWATEDQGNAVVTVTRFGDTSQSSSVDYTTGDDTATAPKDYIATSGTLTFAAGDTSQTFSVLVVNDGLVDGTEDLTLTLRKTKITTSRFGRPLYGMCSCS
jgi:Calx-beta domain